MMLTNAKFKGNFILKAIDDKYVSHATTEILLNNIDNTFVTPVFSGSASLRNAAGQMIEDVAWAGKTNKTVDNEYIQGLYGKMKSLYHLEKVALGDFPAGSIVLLASIGTIWVAMGTILIVKKVKKRKNDKCLLTYFKICV